MKMQGKVLFEGEVIGDGEITMEPIHMVPVIPTLASIEHDHIVKVLEHFDGNKTKATKALGITIKTLYNKLHAYGEFERFAIKRGEANGDQKKNVN